MSDITPQTPEGQPSDEGSSPMVRFQRVMVAFVRGLFAQCPPGAYRWDPETAENPLQEGSEIWIGTETPISPDIVAMRPAVSIGRGPAAFHGIGLGDQAYIDQATGAHVKMDMIPMTMNINVVSRMPMEAEELAWFIARHIWNLRNEILRGNTFILYTGQRPALSPPSPAGTLVSGPETEHNWSAVGISMPVYLQHMEVAMPLNKPVLREVVMVATASGPKPKLRPRRALSGTAVFQPQPERVPAPPTSTALSGEAPATLPQTGPDEAQSSEPLTVRFKT